MNNVTEENKKHLASMLTCLHDERMSIAQRSNNLDEDMLAWATACSEEAIEIWRIVGGKGMELAMLDFLNKRANGMTEEEYVKNLQKNDKRD